VKKDPGLEAWRQRLEAAESSEKPPEKPIEDMSDEELDAAITEAKRELIEAQRAELRTRKQEPESEEGRRSFAEFIKPRPYWR
jgi:ribosomal protein L29